MMKIILTNKAQLLRTFIIINGKIFTGSHDKHMMLYDDILSKYPYPNQVPYYCYPRGALYKDTENNKEIYKLVGPKELNEIQQLKIIEALKISKTNCLIGYSDHYSEYQVREFAEHEYLSDFKNIEDKVMIFIDQIKKIR